MKNDSNEMIARLLDGKLSDQERKNFLAQLDQGDGRGWRSLALGFLEQQILTKALEKWQEHNVTEMFPARKRSAGPLRWFGGVAVALALGLFLGKLSTGSANEDRSKVTATQPAESPKGKSDLVLDQVSHSMDQLKGSLDAIGYDSEIKGGYLEASLSDGRQLIVPISHVAAKRR